jgi:hypothetical protein
MHMKIGINFLVSITALLFNKFGRINGRTQLEPKIKNRPASEGTLLLQRPWTGILILGVLIRTPPWQAGLPDKGDAQMKD